MDCEGGGGDGGGGCSGLARQRPNQRRCPIGGASAASLHRSRAASSGWTSRRDLCPGDHRRNPRNSEGGPHPSLQMARAQPEVGSVMRHHQMTS